MSSFDITPQQKRKMGLEFAAIIALATCGYAFVLSQAPTTGGFAAEGASIVLSFFLAIASMIMAGALLGLKPLKATSAQRFFYFATAELVTILFAWVML